MSDLTDKVCIECGEPPEWAEKKRDIKDRRIRSVAPPYSGLACSNKYCKNYNRIPDGGIGWLVDRSEFEERRRQR